MSHALKIQFTVKQKQGFLYPLTNSGTIWAVRQENSTLWHENNKGAARPPMQSDQHLCYSLSQTYNSPTSSIQYSS